MSETNEDRPLDELEPQLRGAIEDILDDSPPADLSHRAIERLRQREIPTIRQTNWHAEQRCHETSCSPLIDIHLPINDRQREDNQVVNVNAADADTEILESGLRLELCISKNLFGKGQRDG